MRQRLRTRLSGVAVAVLLAATAGCGKTGDVDGNLTDDWAVPAAPAGFTPRTATCHLSNYAPAGPRATYQEVDCKLRHRTETAYVGTFPSPAADAAGPPAEGSAGARAAYRTCDLRTAEYVGGPWRPARLWIGVTHPTPAAWSGGARWFRCEVVEVSSVEDDGGLVQRVGSLRNALKSATSPLRLTCYAIKLGKGGAVGSMPAAKCTEPHNAEFVGIWNAAADAPYPARDSDWAALHAGCRQLVADHVGVPNDADLQYRTGVVSLPGGEDVWALGDHAVRCYLWLDGATLRTSLKGRGPTAMPVQYK